MFLSIYSLLIHPKLLITPHCWRSGKLVAPCVCSMCSARASGELQFKILMDHPGTSLGLGHAFCRNMKDTFQRNARSVTRDRRHSFCSWSGRNGDLTLVLARRSVALFLVCNSWRVAERQSPCSSSRSDNRSCGAAAPA